MPTVRIVDGDCRGDDELAITYQEEVQSCAPGGDCALMSSTPLSARDLWIEAVGCEGPLVGRFVPTRRSCEGHPVWRYRGAVPVGRPSAVVGSAWSGYPLPVIAGEPGHVSPRWSLPRSREIRTIVHPQLVLDVTLTARALLVTPTNGGTELAWDSELEHPGRMPYDAAVLRGQVPSADVDVAGDKGRFVVDVTETVVEIRYSRSIRVRGHGHPGGSAHARRWHRVGCCGHAGAAPQWRVPLTGSPGCQQ